MKYLLIYRYLAEAATAEEAKSAPAVFLSFSILEKQRMTSKPGDIFGYIILILTGQHTEACGVCGARKKQMNQWGWIGCWKHRQEIIDWIRNEAQMRGHEVEDGSVLDLLKAAVKEKIKI